MRECPETQSSKSNFYTLYNEWRKKSYPPEGKPSKKQWESVVNADKEINYESMPMDEKVPQKITVLIKNLHLRIVKPK